LLGAVPERVGLKAVSGFVGSTFKKRHIALRHHEDGTEKHDKNSPLYAHNTT